MVISYGDSTETGFPEISTDFLNLPPEKSAIGCGGGCSAITIHHRRQHCLFLQLETKRDWVTGINRGKSEEGERAHTSPWIACRSPCQASHKPNPRHHRSMSTVPFWWIRNGKLASSVIVTIIAATAGLKISEAIQISQMEKRIAKLEAVKEMLLLNKAQP